MYYMNSPKMSKVIFSCLLNKFLVLKSRQLSLGMTHLWRIEMFCMTLYSLCSSDIWRVQKIEVWHFQMLKSFRKLSYIFPRKWGVMTWKSQHEMLLLEEEERKRRRMPIITCPLSLLVQLVVWKSPVDHLLSTHLDLLQTQVSSSIVRIKVNFFQSWIYFALISTKCEFSNQSDLQYSQNWYFGLSNMAKTDVLPIWNGLKFVIFDLEYFEKYHFQVILCPLLGWKIQKWLKSL